jgi:hypothetical protein
MESPDETNSHQRMERGERERWVHGKWSHHMSFKKSSSRVEKGNSFRWSCQERYKKGFGITCQSVVRVQKMIQNPPRQ